MVHFQQELNIHNVFSSSVRIVTLKTVILGFGAVLPLAAMVSPVRRRLEDCAVAAPPAALVPSFVLTYVLYEWYPWKYTGETVELALGLGFLFASIEASGRFAEAAAGRQRLRSLSRALTGGWARVKGKTRPLCRLKLR